MARGMSTLEELLEEAKRRTVLFVIIVLTVAYCMSLTSDSVLINIPIAILLVAVARRISMELVIFWRPSVNIQSITSPYPSKRLSPKDPLLSTQPSSTQWKSKIDSPPVEAAIEEFTHRIVAEFLTDLWYSALTPDQEVPQEIRTIINGAIGEVSLRAKQVNLINLLTSDVVNVVSSHLELYRQTQATIGLEYFDTLSTEGRDEKIKECLTIAKKLHPAASTLEMERQVLQKLMGGVLAIVLRPEETQCKVVRSLARELLACAVMRPVMNFACPRTINEIIELLVISSAQTQSPVAVVETKAQPCKVDSSTQYTKTEPLHGTYSGVELAEVGHNEDDYFEEETSSKVSSMYSSRIRGDSRDTSSIYSHRSGDWAHALDAFNQRRTQALAPEHLDNLWAKGRNYKKKDAKKNASKPGALEQQLEETSSGEISELQDIRTVKTAEGSTEQDSRIIVVGEDSVGLRLGGTASRVLHHPLEIPESSQEEDTKKVQRHRRSHSSGGFEQEKYSDTSRKQISPSTYNYKSKLSCKVIGAHYEKAGSKAFVVYSISVTDADDQTWVVLRRYRNFEQLHRRLRDMPHYTLNLPPKRFLSSNLDASFVRERCVLLNKYLKDLLSIPSIAELHEVWDFLSTKSQNYGFGEPVSIMKALAVNVDDAVDDVFRQIKGVSEGVLKTATTGLKKTNSSEGSSHYGGSSIWSNTNIYSNYVLTEGPNTDDEADDDYESGWHSDSEVHNLGRNRLEASLSEGHSPVESLAGSEMAEDDTSREWNPPKMIVPLLNLVDVVFQLEGRGWLRRQVLWMAKQVLQLGMADAIDDWLLSKVQYLRREDVIVSGIKWVQQALWPEGIFLTKHPKFRPTNNGHQFSFEEQLEASRRAMVVRELIQDRAPAALVSLIGRKQYRRCAKDIYGFLQSQVCIKQLAYSLLEKLIAAAFPELEDLIAEIHNIGTHQF